MKTRELIKSTPTFQSLSRISQQILLSRNQVKAMEHNITLAKNIGYEKFESQSSALYRNKLIVKEILNQELCKKQ